MMNLDYNWRRSPARRRRCSSSNGAARPSAAVECGDEELSMCGHDAAAGGAGGQSRGEKRRVATLPRGVHPRLQASSASSRTWPTRRFLRQEEADLEHACRTGRFARRSKRRGGSKTRRYRRSPRGPHQPSGGLMRRRMLPLRAAGPAPRDARGSTSSRGRRAIPKR
jgi:hypothetical protein